LRERARVRGTQNPCPLIPLSCFLVCLITIAVILPLISVISIPPKDLNSNIYSKNSCPLLPVPSTHFLSPAAGLEYHREMGEVTPLLSSPIWGEDKGEG